MGQPDVICLGETMAMVAPVDAVPLADSESFRVLVGGAESTVAMYLAELGYRTAWVSALGDDPLATRILRALGSQGVDLSFVRLVPSAPTGAYFKDPGGQQTTVHYYRKGSAASGMGPDLLESLPLTTAKLVHTTGITPALSASCSDLMSVLCDRVQDTGTKLSFDVNYRPGLWSVEEAGPVLLSLARRADYVLVGRDEAEVLWQTSDARSVHDLVQPRGKLVVKDGAEGATEFSGGEEVFVPAAKVEVVEVVGAGDAFAAGYLAAQLQGRPAEEALRGGHRLASRTLRSMDDFVPLGSGETL